MTTKLDPKKISQLLNQSARELDESTLSALQQARAKAMQRQATPAQTLQLAGHRWISLLIPHTVQQWIMAGLLALVLAGGASMWWQQHHHQQIIELDVEILTDELPIELFVD
jgi:Tfp pilus assembly protein FimT